MGGVTEKCSEKCTFLRIHNAPLLHHLFSKRTFVYKQQHLYTYGEPFVKMAVQNTMCWCPELEG